MMRIPIYSYDEGDTHILIRMYDKETHTLWGSQDCRRCVYGVYGYPHHMGVLIICNGDSHLYRLQAMRIRRIPIYSPCLALCLPVGVLGIANDACCRDNPHHMGILIICNEDTHIHRLQAMRMMRIPIYSPSLALCPSVGDLKIAGGAYCRDYPHHVGILIICNEDTHIYRLQAMRA